MPLSSVCARLPRPGYPPLLPPGGAPRQRLPQDALAEFAAQLCADDSAAAQAEALLAAHDPVPQWAVEGVLLSSDLRAT